MKTLRWIVALILVCAPAIAQNANTLAVGKIAPGNALKTKMERANKGLVLQQVTESLDSQLIDRLNQGRKFKIVAGSDLGQVIKSQELQNSGNFNANDPATAQQFKAAGIKYLLLTSVDDFDDQTQRLRDNQTQTTTTVRRLRITGSVRIFEATTAKLLESASTTLSTNRAAETLNEATNDAEITDDMLLPMVRNLAEWAANRVSDVAFPIKVIARTDKQVTINRGEDSGVKVGQIFAAQAQGAELKDPDTGEVLGREELAVGKVRITEVTPKFSKGEVIEDFGIAIGAVLRPPSAASAAQAPK